MGPTSRKGHIVRERKEKQHNSLHLARAGKAEEGQPPEGQRQQSWKGRQKYQEEKRGGDGWTGCINGKCALSLWKEYDSRD